jgi:hypothetical protein
MSSIVVLLSLAAVLVNKSVEALWLTELAFESGAI